MSRISFKGVIIGGIVDIVARNIVTVGGVLWQRHGGKAELSSASTPLSTV